MSKWYERLTEVRSTKGLSQQELSDKLEVHLTSLNRYEKGRGADDLPNKFKIKLLKFFTKNEVEYIEYGEKSGYSKNSIGDIGNNSNVNQGGSQNITTSDNIVSITDDERMLLSRFRKIKNDKIKDEIIMYVLQKSIEHGE